MKLSESDIRALRGGVWKDFSKPQIDTAVTLCETYQLNPLRNEIYIIVRKGRPMAQVSIDGCRIRAGQHPDYEGQTAPLWCGTDGDWRDVWLDSANPPAACKIGVYRKGAREPTYAVLTWAEYVGNAGRIAKTMKAHMLAKATEMLALRKAFPDTFAGLYAIEELDAEGRENMPDAVVDALVDLAEAAGVEDVEGVRSWASVQPASRAGSAIEKMMTRLVESLGELPEDADDITSDISDVTSRLITAVDGKDVKALGEAVAAAKELLSS